MRLSMRGVRWMALVLLLPLLVSAQPPDTLWTASWDGGGEEEWVNAISSTLDGGFILTGQTDSAATYYRCWLGCVDHDGSLLWQQSFGSGDSEKGFYVEQTSDSGFVFCGETSTYSQYDSYGGFVVQLDSEGDQQWHWFFSSEFYHDYASCVREMPNQDLMVGGLYEGLPFLARLTSSGDPIWFNTYPINGAIYYHPEFVDPTPDGGCVLGGWYDIPAAWRATLWKVDAEGDLEWVADSLDAVVYCVRATEDGHYFTAGLQNSQDGNSYNRQIVEYDENGEVIWERRYITAEDDKAYAIYVAQDGNLYVAGKYWVQAELNYMQWIAKVERNGGDIIWETSPLLGQPISLCVARDGGIAYAGPDEFGGAFPEESNFTMVKLAPEVTVSVVTQTNEVPSAGGSLLFDETLSNILLDPTSLDRWTLILGPDGFQEAGLPVVTTLQPGESVTNENELFTIPGDWPDGDYTFELHYGDHPNAMRNMGLGTFTFTKGGSAVGDPGSPAQQGILPLEFTLQASPNPFNASTTIQVSLPHPCELTVAVFNIRGQRVAVLANSEPTPAGRHSLTFEGSHLASGMYLVRASIPNELDQVQKLMLIR